MKKLAKGYFMALSMFTVIPMPQNGWEEDSLSYMAMFLPLVGVLVGGLWLLLYKIVLSLGPNMVSPLLVSFGPHLITGFLHLDGFMDTNDAILSRRDREEKLRILKDPHAGAYGVLAVILLILLNFTGVSTLMAEARDISSLFLVPVFSRGMAGLWVLKAKPLPDSTLLKFFKEKGSPNHVYVIFGTMGLTLLWGYYFLGTAALLIGAAAMIAFQLAGLFVRKILGGFSGDLSGYCISISECVCILLLTILV